MLIIAQNANALVTQTKRHRLVNLLSKMTIATLSTRNTFYWQSEQNEGKMMEVSISRKQKPPISKINYPHS